MIVAKFVSMTLARSTGSKAALKMFRPSPSLFWSSRWQNASAVREPALPEAHTAHTDMVRSAVKELLERKEPTKTISVEQLQQRHQNFKVRDTYVYTVYTPVFTVNLLR